MPNISESNRRQNKTVSGIDGVRRVRPNSNPVRTAPQAPSEPVREIPEIYDDTYSAEEAHPVRTRGKRWWAVRSIAVLAVIVVIGAGAAIAYMLRPNSNKFAAVNIAKSLAKVVVASKPQPLLGQDKDRTNIVIYGMTKDGLRTDSIMLASYYYSEHKLVTVNIPRDLYVYDGYENAKMGEVYAYALGRQPRNKNYASEFVASMLGKEYGIPVNYWVKLNMQGEVQLVDTLGGIDINVPDTFTDYEYPKWDYSGYIRPAPHFVAGPAHMNGTTALVYSRSRHSLDGSEGTDFARSKRQALVLASVMTKVKTMGILGNLGDITKYLTILGQNVDTNMSTDEMLAAAQLFNKVDSTNDYLKGNWATGNGFLCSSTSSVGAYIALYGIQSDCGAQAGVASTNVYRQKAISYIQDLLGSVSKDSGVLGASTSSGDTATPTPTPLPVAQ